jgi:hypothetical protein
VKKEKVMKYSAVNNQESLPVWVRFRATSYGDFSSFLDEVEQHNQENIWNYYIENVMMSFEQARNAVNQAFVDAKTKKELTHKLVRISQGATCLPNTYRTIWIKK